MNSIILNSSGLILCSAIIAISGSQLSKYGDIIAELTGMGKAWIGLILMAAVTSLPELFSGISAIVVMDSPDIAVGGIMGSLSFNLVILAILDFFVPQKPLSSIVTKEHVLAGFLGMILVTLAVIEILYSSLMPDIGWISTFPIVLIILYIITVRIIFENERRMNGNSIIQVSKRPIEQKTNSLSLRTAVKRYIFYATFVVIAALFLPYFADHLAVKTGISKSFIGTLLVAATTSLPELVISIAAVRIGSMDMAVGNLLGSNIFNMFILAFNDTLYKGPLLLAGDPNHALSGLVTILMTAVVGIGILAGYPKKRFMLGIDAIILILLYLALITALYFLG